MADENDGATLNIDSPVKDINAVARKLGIPTVGTKSPQASGPKGGMTKHDVLKALSHKSASPAGATGGAKSLASSPAVEPSRAAGKRRSPHQPPRSPAPDRSFQEKLEGLMEQVKTLELKVVALENSARAGTAEYQWHTVANCQICGGPIAEEYELGLGECYNCYKEH